MLNIQITITLEEIATELRKILQISPSIILNSNHLSEISKKIETNFDNFKIEITKHEPYLLLENYKDFTIHINNEKDCFYDLVEQLCFGILLNRKSLSNHELQHSVYHFPRISYETDYLMLAFMMPKEAFYSTLVHYSSGDGSSIQMLKMQKEVNKYCYKRGKHLHIW